jgi:methylmalonyl-CoA mutase
MSEKLFAEFPPISTEQWMEVVAKDLKGQDFEKRLVSTTEDGIKVKPIYRREDLPAGVSDSLARGFEASGRSFVLREEVRQHKISEANEHALECLEEEAEELSWLTYPGGCFIWTPAEMQELLDSIYIEALPIHWICGPMAPQILALLIGEAERRGLDLGELQGSLDLDPILDSAAGWTTLPMGDWKTELFPTLQVILNRLPKFGTLAIRGSLLEKAGASNAQELAFSLNLCADLLAGIKEALTNGTLTVPGSTSIEESLNIIVARSEYRLAVGTTYFLEIAKLRAARILLANMLDAFGISARPKIHVVTTPATKTLYDSHNNLLRATVESMAGILGGCDSLTVAAYDQGYHSPDEFSGRLARNTEILLKEEAYLGKVSDPLGGSYAVESLTASTAEAAWKLFNKVESEGGFVAAWQKGFIQSELYRVQDVKAKAANSRRISIVGTSSYPNLKEKKLVEIVNRPAGKKAHPSYCPGGSFEGVVAKVQTEGAGSFLSQESIGDSPLNPFRPSWPFENLRLRTENHAAQGGKVPKVLLILFGDRTMRKARATFCTGFFGCGGYQVRETVAESLTEAAHLQADLFVLCSSDAEYAEGVEAFLAGSPQAPVVVAGLPENAEALKSLGITDFVHIRQNLVEVLSQWHESFGIPHLPH